MTNLYGSPPLARGRRYGRAQRLPDAGIPPARAGTAPEGGPHRAADRDHPRSRGDGLMTAISNAETMGSPPLARGRLLGRPVRPRRRGITPARAGTAVPAPGSPASSRDHPRSRGDGGSTNWSTSGESGSPPLARGRQHHRCHGDMRVRITPARAGTALPDLRQTLSSRRFSFTCHR